MAIDYKQFVYSNSDKQAKALENGLQSNKDFTKYLYIFRIEGRLFRKTLNLTKSTELSKSDLIKKANAEALKYKAEKEEELISDTTFTLNTKFDELAKEYIINKMSATFDKEKKKWIAPTKWGNEKLVMLNNYIYPHLKNKKASSIKERDIDKIRISMETSGYAKQNKNGCSPRTIRKILNQVLKPILEYGFRNGAIKRIPDIALPKKPKKKSVKNGAEKLTSLYKAIHTLYKDDPFYRGLFLFAFFGRRWNEIRTLEWTDIDFIRGEYTIRGENSKIGEDKTFTLPKDVSETLGHFSDAKGLVFRSRKTGRELTLPKKQMDKLKEASGIENLTLHYFRHIMATALGESGMVNTVLSASLGHNNSQTVDSYYRTANHLRGSEEATQAIEHIVEVVK